MDRGLRLGETLPSQHWGDILLTCWECGTPRRGDRHPDFRLHSTAPHQVRLCGSGSAARSGPCSSTFFSQPTAPLYLKLRSRAASASPTASTTTPGDSTSSRRSVSSLAELRWCPTPRRSLKRTPWPDRKSTRLNSSHLGISYAV